MTKFLAAIAVAVLLSGCNGTFDLRESAETAVHIKLLDAEFDRAVATVKAIPLDADETMATEQAIATLQVEREFLRTLHEQNAQTIVMTGALAQTHLDDLSAAYMLGYRALENYYTRTGMAPPANLVAYDQSARLAYERVQASIDSGSAVSGAELSQALFLGLRVLAAANGVPL